MGKDLDVELERLIVARSKFCFRDLNFIPIVANGGAIDRCKIEQTHYYRPNIFLLKYEGPDVFWLSETSVGLELTPRDCLCLPSARTNVPP